jgi:NAD(P)-dependent dehydrogenase (short-subunit alcohol dehydrogenase family)
VDYEDKDFDTVINVNLKGVFNCLRAQLGTIEKGGSIVNISSVGGLHGVPGASAYIASKFGVRGLIRVVAQEAAADGTRVNAICP